MRGHSGFSLVELSIVLVILGLLAGGILAGQSLIHAAELRSVTVDVQRFTTASHAFRDRYFGVPGDFAKATDFWGASAAPASCFTTAGTGTQTCNGNGNGYIEWALAGGENYGFWKHLANAGLVEGNYTGIASSGAEVAGTNIARSKLPNTGFVAFSDNGTLYGYHGHAFMIADQIASGAYEGGVVKAEDAWNLDTKMDDGRADSGHFLTASGNGETGCITGTNWVKGAAYNLTDTSVTCRLVAGF